VKLGRKTSKALALVKQRVLIPKELLPDAQTVARRDVLLAEALTVTQVTSLYELEVAGATARELRQFAKDCKAARETYSKPIRAVLDRLMELLKDAVTPVEAQVERIEALATEYNDKEAARVQAEEDERQRKANELIEKQRLAEQKLAETTAPKAAAKLEEKIAKTEAAYNSAVATPVAAAATTKGQTRREVLRVEVISATEVYKTRPELCKVEVRLSEVQSRCVAAKGSTRAAPDMTTVPGLRLWWETPTNFRT
jgi:chemotaxis protein histidine kinase CheA